MGRTRVVRSQLAHAMTISVAVAGGARAQQLQWRELAPTAVPSCQVVFDAARNRFVAVAGPTLEWDGTDWQVRRTAQSPPPREGFGLAWAAARARTVLFGGDNGGVPRADLWEYDGVDWSQRATGPGPVARGWPAQAYDPLLLAVVVFGGRGGNGALGDTWLWNGVGWTQLPGAGPSARGHAAMAYHGATGDLVLFGGDVGGDETWRLTGTSWLRVQPSTTPPPRNRHRLCTDDHDGVVWMFGDEDQQLWRWDGSDWSTDAGGPEPRFDAGLCSDGRGTTLVFGGTHVRRAPGLPLLVTRPSSDTWLRDAAGWRRVRSAPPALVEAQLAYDIARDRVVLCSSTSDNLFPQPTREWDGERWLEIAGSQVPWSSGYRICHDAARGRTVRFGGLVQSATFFGVVADLREWDGAVWTQVQAAGPAARFAHAMAFDGQRGVTLLFGGSVISSILGDTWQWDGGAWTQVATGGPPPRMMHAMACDLPRAEIVLFGGLGNAGVLGDTWVWYGTHWTQRSPLPAPSPRRSCAFDYDFSRTRCVLLGGRDGGGTFLAEQWAWDGAQWTGGPAPLPLDTLSAADAAGAYRGDRWLRLSGGGLWIGARTVAAATSLGTGCGAATVPALTASGEPVAGRAAFAAELHRLPPGAPFALGLAAGRANTSLPGNCTLHLPGLDLLLVGLASPAGTAQALLPVPANPTWLGLEVSLQAACLDAAMPIGLALSNGLLAVVGS